MLRNSLKRHRFLVAAVLLGLTGFVFSYRLFSLYVKTAPVVVVSKNLDAYTRFTQGDIRLAYLPVKGIPADGLRSMEEAIGGYSSTALLQGQIVQAGHVSKGKEEIGLSEGLPPGTRAMFIPATAARGAGGLVRKGERVDVICAPKGPSYGQVVVFRDIPVIEVVRDQTSKEFQGALVELTPQECEIVATSIESSSLYLTLVPRNSGTGLVTEKEGQRGR